jgi:CheY-like chemotaxis protein
MTDKKTCFFIDDDAGNLSVFTRALTYVTPETICFVASDTEDALELMIAEEIIPSCIFVKEYLREIYAEEFLRKIKVTELLKDVPVIVHGTEFLDGNIEELKRLGALAIYTKPFTFLGVSNMLSLYFHPTLISIGQN